MALIFTGSSDPHSSEHSSRFLKPLLLWFFPTMSPETFDAIHLLFRKCCHLAEYSVLALLLWRALSRSKNLPAWSWPRVGGTLLVVFLYGASDEFHQRYVPTRTSHFTDVLIDTAGGAIGLLAFCVFSNLRKRE